HLDIMSKDDLETAKTFNTKEDASEMVDKYAKKVNEINFEKPPVTVKEKKNRIPKSRKSVRGIMRDPESLDEAITQLLLTTRIKTSDFVRHMGFGEKNDRGKII